MSRGTSVSVKIVKDIDPKAIDRLRQRLVGDGRVVNVGTRGGEQSMIARVHEFGSPSKNIPERPFLRTAIRRNQQKYGQLNQGNLVKMLRGQTTVDRALGELGEMAKTDVQAEISHGNFTPLKPATVKRKGSSRPLIDKGDLYESIDWELGDKTSLRPKC